MSSENLREAIAWLIYYDCTDCPYINEGDCVEPKLCKFTLDKADQILSHLKSQIEQMKNPYVWDGSGDGRVWNYHQQKAIGFRRCIEDILSKLQ